MRIQTVGRHSRGARKGRQAPAPSPLRRRRSFRYYAMFIDVRGGKSVAAPSCYLPSVFVAAANPQSPVSSESKNGAPRQDVG
jgi:hypothetical protein